MLFGGPSAVRRISTALLPPRLPAGVQASALRAGFPSPGREPSVRSDHLVADLERERRESRSVASRPAQPVRMGGSRRSIQQEKSPSRIIFEDPITVVIAKYPRLICIR